MNIVNAGKIVGSFALNERRIIDLATLAKYARASTVPAVIALAGTELLKYGLQKCSDGTWCKQQAAQQTPSEGYIWRYGGLNMNVTSLDDACAKLLAVYTSGTSCRLYGTDNYETYFQAGVYNSNNNLIANPQFLKQPGCASGYTLQNGVCTKPANVVPAGDADIETAWKGAFQTDPFIQERYWGFEDQTKNLQAWAEALAQTAEVINGSVTEVRPEEKTTTSVGTTTKQTTCTYTAVGTADKVNPVNVTERCTTTTTAADGTQTQEITEKSGPAGADKVATKVEVETCGLPGKPACKIDETGTPTEQAGKDRITAAQTELTTARQAAEQQLRDAAQVSTFGLAIPTLLPGGSCQPIQFFKWKEFDGTVDLCERLGFIRTLLSWLWGALAAIYIYNRVSSANA